MANFEPISQWLLYQEDDHKTPGKIENLGDGAGLTRLGITSNNFGNVVPSTFFTVMPFKEAVKSAKDFYRSQEWHHLRGDDIQSDELAACLLSFAVNKSVPTATKKLQQILGLDDDGVLGQQTLAEANSKEPKALVIMFRAAWISYYHHIVDVNPSNQRFLQGWLNRANFPYPSSLVPTDLYAS